jgi:CheY-like chemotaxis protein
MNEPFHPSILIVDEDPDVLGFLTLLFETRDIRVLRARSRSEAMEVLRKPFVPLHLIVANIMTANMGGQNFCDTVTTLRPGVSVIYMSAFVDSGVIRIEAIKRLNLSGMASADERGILDSVLSELSKPQARASGR